MQAQITAGDSLDAMHHVPGYPASAGWTLTYRLVPRSAAGGALTLQATPAGDAYRVQAPAASTAAWPAGPYTWVAWVTRGTDPNTETHTVAQGELMVQPDPRHLAPGADGRSLARRTLDELLQAKARWDLGEGNQRRYRIGEREMEFKSAAELERLIRFWEYRVAQESPDAASRPAGRFFLRAT